jgi:hypothetical protein
LDRFIFRRSVVVDGNFHADHLKMRNPEDDVELADGLAFMVKSGPYQEHLKESKDMKQVHYPLVFSGLHLILVMIRDQAAETTGQ